MPVWDQAEYESSTGKKMVTAAFTHNSKRTKTYENVEKRSYIFKPTIAYTISLVRQDMPSCRICHRPPLGSLARANFLAPSTLIRH